MQFIDDENFERGRLEFLANLTNAARSYNMSIMEIVQNQEIVGGWAPVRHRLRAKLEDLKKQTHAALSIIANTKPNKRTATR
jgi:hypothetical protein